MLASNAFLTRKYQQGLPFIYLELKMSKIQFEFKEIKTVLIYPNLTVGISSSKYFLNMIS